MILLSKKKKANTRKKETEKPKLTKLTQSGGKMSISIFMCKWFGVHFLIMPLWFPNHFMYMPHITDAWKGKQPFQVQHSVFNLRYPRLKKCTPYSTSHWGTAGSQKVCFFPEDQYFYPTVLQIQFCSAIPVCHPELPSLHLRPKMDRRVIDWNKMHTCLIKEEDPILDISLNIYREVSILVSVLDLEIIETFITLHFQHLY